MTPEQMAERLAEWVREPESWHDAGLPDCPAMGRVGMRAKRRVDCVEDDGARRTWVLWESGRQCGHVRMRATYTPFKLVTEGGLLWGKTRPEIVCQEEWTIEASDRTRAMLGL